ncbi:MAG TPA: cytochrome c peroxidase, partial [Blastocatellia bacterium]
RGRRRRPQKLALAVMAILFLIAYARTAPASNPEARSWQVRLGARLFKEERFSAPKGDFIASCSICHLTDEDPQGARAFTDFFARSWVPFRSTDPRRDGLRNTPTILDVAGMQQLHFDGEFGSLEQLVKGTISGRNFGYLAGEQDEAYRRVHQTIVNDAGDRRLGRAPYRDEFKKAYGMDPASLSPEQLVELVAKAVSEFMRTLKTNRTSPYDLFIEMNGLETGPGSGETAGRFASRLLARISDLEQKGGMKFPRGFDRGALDGMKIFLRTEGASSAGNCVACHAPPAFTDAAFHNVGITQIEYDRIHGEGSFARLKIPAAAEAVRPAQVFRELISRDKPGNADLGYWNYASLTGSAMRRRGESDERFLQRMIAAFKTPTLRNLAYSQPYMHNGAYGSVTDTIAELMRLSAMAREGRVREAADELARIRINQEDVAKLAAFLDSLNEDLKHLPQQARGQRSGAGGQRSFVK